MVDETVLRLGTRGSPLALAQADETRRRLAQAHGWAPERVEIVPIKTTGDAIQDRALSEAGGKGLFTKELDRALIDGGIDFAVHSGKDLPTLLPDELEIAGYLPREDVRDAFVSPHAPRLEDLPQGAVVGSASLRRQAQVKRLRPDLEVQLLRGNVQTRLRRIESGDFHATILALAGLKRLGLEGRVTAILDTEQFLPAVAQGAIAITVRAGDAATRQMLAPIIDEPTGVCVGCERSFLTVLDGSCRTPIAGHARLAAGRVNFHGMVLSPDGAEAADAHVSGLAADAPRLGEAAARDLLSRAPAHLLAPFGRSG